MSGINYIDKLMDKKWFRVLVFIILIMNALAATAGVILMSLEF